MNRGLFRLHYTKSSRFPPHAARFRAKTGRCGKARTSFKPICLHACRAFLPVLEPQGRAATNNGVSFLKRYIIRSIQSRSVCYLLIYIAAALPTPTKGGQHAAAAADGVYFVSYEISVYQQSYVDTLMYDVFEERVYECPPLASSHRFLYSYDTPTSCCCCFFWLAHA